MPAITDAEPPQTTPKKVLTAIHNIPKRINREPSRTRAPGKENVLPGDEPSKPHQTRPRRRPAPLLLARTPTGVLGLSLGSHAPSPATITQDIFSPALPSPSPNEVANADPATRWAPSKDGKIVIKVWVPSTGDTWKFRVPEDVRLESFRTRVAAKVGFEVSFASLLCGTLKTVADDAAFREWVEARVGLDGRKALLTAHRLVLP